MKGKILIVEDSLTIQRVFELAFLRSGYQVTYIDRGKDLKSMAQELKPEVVICDLTLPDIDGFEAVSEIKADTTLSSIPFILLAGSIEPFDEDLFKSSGADGVIFKPFDSQELLDKIDELVRERKEIPSAERKRERELAEEGWDFSDVFEDVELGVSGVDEKPAEEPFLTELIADSDLPEIEKVEDYDIGVEELGMDESSAELANFEDLRGKEESEAASTEEEDEFDDLMGDLEEEIRDEVQRETEIVSEVEEDEGRTRVDIAGTELMDEERIIQESDQLEKEADISPEVSADFDKAEDLTVMEEEAREGVEEEEIPELPVEEEVREPVVEEETPGLPVEEEVREPVVEEETPGLAVEEEAREPVEEEEIPGLAVEEEAAEYETGEDDRLPVMDEEDRMMEEIVRNVDDFPISEGYDFASHGILKRAAPPKGPINSEKVGYEDKMSEVFSSDDFKDELMRLVSDVTEKILWDVLPGIMDEVKGDIVAVIKEVSASVVPDVAGRIIQEEIRRIREEIDLTE